MNRDQLQAALNQMGSAYPSDADSYAFHGALKLIMAAAHAYLRLLSLNGQWDETIVQKIWSILADYYVNDYAEATRAVLSALTEEG
jgi:hypothetical protein